MSTCCLRHPLVEGRPRPRVETHAPYTLSRAQEAIGWAAKVGLVPDDWQDDALDRILAVDATGKWVHFECGEIVPRQNGKGSILEIRALAGLFVFGEELIMWSAHEYKTAMEAFLRCLKLLRRIGTQVGNNPNLLEVDGHTVKISNTNGEEGFELLDTKQRLKFIARSKGSGRGFSGDLNIIDEAFAYTYAQQQALLFTMGARRNPQIVYTSSPPLDGISGDVMFDLKLRGDPTAKRELSEGTWTQDPSLSWRDWGLGGDLEDLSGIVLDDPGVWKATNPSLDVVRVGGASALTTDGVGREWRALRNNPAGFASDRLGVWPKRIRGGGGVIPLDLWRELGTTAAESGRPAEVAFAVSVARDRSFTTIAAIGVQQDGRIQLAIAAYAPGTDWVVPRMVELRERWNPLLWAIEDKGPNASLWPALERAGFALPDDRENPQRGDVVPPWANDVVAAYGMFIDALVERRLAHLRDAPLEGAVEGAQTRPLGSGTTWDDKGAIEAGPLKAVTNGLWGWLAYADKVLAERDELGIW
jgi:hypothetical protein